jgi:hypothetical protein
MNVNHNVSHESYINAVVEAAKAMVTIRNEDGSLTDDSAAKLAKINATKVVYGQGMPGALGVTYYNKWNPTRKDFIGPVMPAPVVEVCAQHQSNWTQVAHTVIHELGHVLAGYGHGHDKVFKEACEELGLRAAKAVANRDTSNLSGFHPKLRAAITSLPLPTDGTPIQVANRLGVIPSPKPCGAGIGTKGGKSRGVGSGSRLVKCQCPTCGYTVRTTAKWIAAGYPICPTDNISME